MHRSSKYPRLTSEPSFLAQSDMQFSVPGEEEENSSCSFTFSYLSSSSSSPSSLVMPGAREEEKEKVVEKEMVTKEGEGEGERMEEEKEKVVEKEMETKEGEEEGERMEEEKEKVVEKETETKEGEEEGERMEEEKEKVVEKEMETKEGEEEGEQMEEEKEKVVEKEMETKEGEEEGEGMEEEKKKVVEKEKETKEGEGEGEGIEEEKQEQPAAEMPGPPLRPQRYEAQSTSAGGSRGQEREGTSSLQASADPDSMDSNPLEQKVASLVHYMILKYRLRKPITRAEMRKVVKGRDRSQFPVIFEKACKCLEVISGIDVKEVVPATHSYVLVNSLDLTYDEMLGDLQSMPKNGLLIIILGLIFLEGNCAPEENIWDFLSMLGLYPGREHFIYGEPRKLITKTWVQENYLLYQQVPDSDPPRYKFMWGPRAHAETSKLQVLEFLAKIKGTDAASFSCWYEEALRDYREKAQARAAALGRATALSMAKE